MKHSLYSALTFILLVIGCNNALEPQLVNDLDVAFELKNSAGEVTTEFQKGADIHFEYRLKNASGQLQPYTIPDGGPFARFEILRNDSLLGSSDDGFGYIQVVIQDSLLPDTSMVHQYNWLSVDLHNPLPEGDYMARVVPRLRFTDTETPDQQELAFKILCDLDCDSTAVLRITDLPPGSIEKDAFRLNSAQLNRNILTLNVSHAGGCAEHDYQLYMSPGAFAESIPVQASLYLQHDANGDMCEAWLTRDVSFNIQPMLDLHAQQYGNDDLITINVRDFSGNEPANNLQITYVPEGSDVILLKTGTFFGFCAGYCRFELHISDTTALYFAHAWNSRNVPDRMLTGSISMAESENLKLLLDMDALFALKDVIGCPDCADGGGEWIQATTARGSKKVTFEFGATIPQIDPLMKELRAIRERMHTQMFGEQ